MKEFLITLMAVAILNGVVGMLTPDGNLGKYVRFAGMLCLLCALASPVVTVIGAFGDGGEFLDGILGDKAEREEENYDEIYNNTLMNGSASYAQEIMENALLQHFNLPQDSLSVSVELVMENEAYQIERVVVSLGEQAIFADPRDIISFVNDRWNCTCTVVYG